MKDLNGANDAFEALVTEIFKYYNKETDTFDKEEVCKALDDPQTVRHLKILFNLLFREIYNESQIPFPEVDSYEEETLGALLYALRKIEEEGKHMRF